jgi:hypothetical protein
MTIIIAGAIAVIAVCMAFGKPLNIVITHKYDNPPLSPPDTLKKDTAQEQANDDAAKSMDAVIKTLNEWMGVSSNGEDSSRT